MKDKNEVPCAPINKGQLYCIMLAKEHVEENHESTQNVLWRSGSVLISWSWVLFLLLLSSE